MSDRQTTGDSAVGLRFRLAWKSSTHCYSDAHEKQVPLRLIEARPHPVVNCHLLKNVASGTFDVQYTLWYYPITTNEVSEYYNCCARMQRVDFTSRHAAIRD